MLDRREAIEAALADARPGDVVVIAGKGADTEMELAGHSIPFDDRADRPRGARVIAIELGVVEPLGRLVARPWADDVTGVQIDSRRIREGDLFVAVGGGADFVEHALARGAAAALVPVDATAALATIGAAVRRTVERARRRHHRFDREDIDEGHPLRALRAAPRGRSRTRGTSTTSSACR